jgi:predicted phosphodiesterase
LKLGIVSDLHCNIDGLDRALEIMGPTDALLCLGDSIYEYAFSNEVIGRLRELDALTILGNHEEVFLGAAGVRARSRPEIDRSLLGWLAKRPQRHELRVDGKRILMVHSTPWEPRGSYVLPPAPRWNALARPTPISCFTATRTGRSSVASVGCWWSIPARPVRPATRAMAGS